MYSDINIVEIFYLSDEISKEYHRIVSVHSLKENNGEKTKNKSSKLSTSELMTILTLFDLGQFRNLKHFCKYYVQVHLFNVLFVDGIHLVTTIKRNMKSSLISMVDKILFRKSCVIQTVNDLLKNVCQVEHFRHKSFNNFFANRLIAYSFLLKLPSIKYQIQSQRVQLTNF